MTIKAGDRLPDATFKVNQGGDIGPDLTSFNRRDENNLLLAIVNPSAEIREGYRELQRRDAGMNGR
ncbi:MAG: hypothetical protein HC834_11370 [Rhodospirillales bacterium]|nr:hypothetical protein [Rhodospirillales bacterium]